MTETPTEVAAPEVLTEEVQPLPEDYVPTVATEPAAQPEQAASQEAPAAPAPEVAPEAPAAQVAPEAPATDVPEEVAPAPRPARRPTPAGPKDHPRIVALRKMLDGEPEPTE